MRKLYVNSPMMMFNLALGFSPAPQVRFQSHVLNGQNPESHLRMSECSVKFSSPLFPCRFFRILMRNLYCHFLNAIDFSAPVLLIPTIQQPEEDHQPLPLRIISSTSATFEHGRTRANNHGQLTARKTPARTPQPHLRAGPLSRYARHCRLGRRQTQLRAFPGIGAAHMQG